MDSLTLVENELKIPLKYSKTSSRTDRVEAIVSRIWLRQILKQRRIPEFILHDKLSEEEVNCLFKQGENFGSGWKKIIISILPKGENQVVPLPRVRIGAKPEAQLSLSQVLQYVSNANYKNLWKEAYKKYYGSFKQAEFGEESYVQLNDQSSLLREAISRAYGTPIIRLTDNQYYYDGKQVPQPNLLPATLVIESGSNFFIIYESLLEHTALDCVTFSPALLRGGYTKPMFIIYQLLRLMRHFHDMGLVLGEISLADIYLGPDLWIQVIPRILDNVCLAPKTPDTPPLNFPSSLTEKQLSDLTSSWVVGALSNFDYLCALNKLAGRRYGDPRSHFVIPWVSDLTSRSGADWRDFTKSKFRLNKGDRQLDLTYDLTQSPSCPQTPHHVTDVLSEITYYVYLSRITPKSVLCKYVRPQWVPAEYPASIQRLQSWSPDECIPEFFSDPNVFKSIHNDLGNLEVPSWCSSPQEFVTKHRSMLESQYVSERLNYWIDLTFGYKLSGPAAVKAKNVCLQLVDGHSKLTRSGVVQLFTTPHPHRRPLSPFWGRVPPRIHFHRRRAEPEEDEGHSSGLDEETPPTTNFAASRLFSKSRSSLISSPMSTPSDADRNCLPLPKDYNPAVLLNVVESLHSFTWSNCYRGPENISPLGLQRDMQVQLCQQIVASKRVKEMQTLGCLIVEMFLTDNVRVFGLTGKELKHRLGSCRSVVFHSQSTPLPRCVKELVHLLLEEEYPVVTSAGVPPPSSHQLLQPLLTSPYLVHFSKGFPVLYQAIINLYSYKNIPEEIANRDVSVGTKLSHLKVMSLANCIEQLVEREDTLELILPYILEMLSSPQMDVLAAWYLFDHVARALGPRRSVQHLLEAVVKLYDCDSPREPQLLKKRVKLYHRSFLIRLMVRFGVSIFLNCFVLPLVEAVGGYHDIDQAGHSHLGCNEVEEAVEADIAIPLSPLDEDSLADNDRNLVDPIERTNEPAMFHLDEDVVEEVPKDPNSAVVIENLIIDNLDSHSFDEKEDDGVNACKSNVGDYRSRKKSTASIKHLRLEREASDVEYTKVYVAEVCEVSGESVVWLAQRLGPVLTSRHLSRNLLRMLGLCYTGQDNLMSAADSSTNSGHSLLAVAPTTLVGDNNAFHVLRCLSAIATLYGEQLVIVQYLGHATDLVSICQSKITGVLEGALIGCLTLVSQVVGFLSDKYLSELLNDTLLRGLLHPSLRLLASYSVVIPSGLEGRRALAIKVLACLVALTRRADHKQRVILLQTIQRFFFAFSKAHDNSHQDRNMELPPECELKTKKKLKDDITDSPPLSLSPTSERILQRLQAQEELRDALCPEFAYLAFRPFVDFFGESVMEQTLKNFHLVKQLSDKYLDDRKNGGKPIPGICDIEPLEVVEAEPETPSHIGSFSNVVVVGNRIDLQETGRSVSPGVHEDANKSRKTDTNNRHLHGNWLAYWEHELGRNSKDNHMNVKQIKLQTFCGHVNSVKHIVCLPSENSFMSASRDKTVRLWSLRSQGDGSHISQAQWTYTGHRKHVLGLGWIERQRLTVSSDSSVHLWDPFVGRPIVAPSYDWGSSSSSSSLSSVAVNVLRPLHPPSSAVACATTDGTVRTLDARTGTFVNELKVSQNPGGLIRCLVVSPKSQWLAVGQASGMLTVLDLIAGGVIMAWKAHDAEILQLVAIDETTLVSSALDQTLAVWNINDAKMLHYLKGPTEPVHCLESFGNEIISGTTANRIGVHTSVNPGASFSLTRLRSDTVKGVLTSIAVLPLNRLLLLGSDSGVIVLIC